MIHVDADWIKMVLAKPDGYTGGMPHSRIIFKMLWALYQRQTSDERDMQATVHENGMGFNGFDAPFLSDVARWGRNAGGDLTPAQARSVAKKLGKYVKQLVEIANEKQTVQAPLPKPQRMAVPAVQDILGFEEDDILGKDPD